MSSLAELVGELGVLITQIVADVKGWLASEEPTETGDADSEG